MTRTAQLQWQPAGAYVNLNHLQGLRHLAGPLALPHSMAKTNAISGSHRSRALNRGMEFEEVRLYQPGDDVRNIDWRVTARTQVTHTKCYRDEKEKPVITLVDQRRSLFFGSEYCFKSVYACHLAALINWATIQQGDRAGGLVIGTEGIHEVRPSRSHKGVNRWLQMLYQQNCAININASQTEPALGDGLKQLQRIARSGTDCILITDCYDLDNHECEKLLYQLSRHNTVTIYWVTDKLERKLPLINHINISNGLEKATLALTKNQQKHHEQYFSQKQSYFQNLSQKLSISLIHISTEQDLISTLKNTTRQRQRKR